VDGSKPAMEIRTPRRCHRTELVDARQELAYQELTFQAMSGGSLMAG